MLVLVTSSDKSSFVASWHEVTVNTVIFGMIGALEALAALIVCLFAVTFKFCNCRGLDLYTVGNINDLIDRIVVSSC